MGATAWIEVPQLMPGLVASAVGYDLTALTPGVHRGLPSPYLTFIYSLSGPIVSGESLAQLGSRQAYRTEVLLGGLHQRPAYVAQPVQQAGLQLAVHPLAARALFGVPARELALTGDATDVLGSSATRLQQRLAETPAWSERFALVQKDLRRRFEAHERRSLRAELREAWVWMARHRGTGSMDGLAGHVGLSSRQLTTLFGREVGLPPKQVSRLMRFSYARRRITAAVRGGVRLDLASIAADCGYYDQSHLDRDFAQYVGISPTAWIAEERQNFQAARSSTGANSSHDHELS
jgi:AraC-like DNA-binding protein